MYIFLFAAKLNIKIYLKQYIPILFYKVQAILFKSS